jgi:hypothetical protein
MEGKLKGVETFREELLKGLTDDQLRTIGHVVEEYLKTVEGRIRKAQSVCGCCVEPHDRAEVDHEELAFLYGIARDCSAILFQWTGAAQRHGVEGKLG